MTSRTVTDMSTDVDAAPKRVEDQVLTRTLQAKVRAVLDVALRAMEGCEGLDEDPASLLVAAWAEPDGSVVLHLVSREAASIATHALWSRHVVSLRTSPNGVVPLGVV